MRRKFFLPKNFSQISLCILTYDPSICAGWERTAAQFSLNLCIWMGHILRCRVISGKNFSGEKICVSWDGKYGIFEVIWNVIHLYVQNGCRSVAQMQHNVVPFQYSDVAVTYVGHNVHVSLKLTALSSDQDRLCGLVVRVSGYRYRGLGFDSRRYQIFWVIVGLERGPLSLVRSIEELLE